MSAMKALVTGGAGFIGSHIVDRLLREGYEVRILDNLERRVHLKGRPPYVPREAEFILGDVRNPRDMEKALRDVDIVFHQAAYQDYMLDFSTFIEVNAVSTALIYELIVSKGYEVRKVMVASSQAVYGEGQYLCQEHGRFLPSSRSQERLNKKLWELKCPSCGAPAMPLELEEPYPNPSNQYSLSKYSQELIALRLGRQCGIPTVALRYSITQGPRQSPFNAYSGILRIFSQRLLLDKAPIIFEDGLQKRDYVHIDDVVEANMLVMRDRRADYQVYNVGSGRATTVIEYAHLLSQLLNKSIEPLIRGEYRLGDARHSVSSVEEIKKLGWEPKKSLNTIIADYLSWIKSFKDLSDYFREADKMMRESKVIRQAREG